MPTYEYKCRDCGNHFEVFQSMSDKQLSKCPQCGGSVQRLIGTGAAIILKGRGFYETDYKKKGGGRIRCGSSRTCCGRDVPCDSPPCS